MGLATGVHALRTSGRRNAYSVSGRRLFGYTYGFFFFFNFFFGILFFPQVEFLSLGMRRVCLGDLWVSFVLGSMECLPTSLLVHYQDLL